MVAVPTDGRLTSQNVLNLPISGGEVMYIVSPGNAALGNSYQVTTAVLAAYFGVFPFLTTQTITSGATIGSPYLVQPTDTTILVKKTVGAATYILAPMASTMTYPIGFLVKDIKNDAGSHNITIEFTGGQLCDGLATIVIDVNYGWAKIVPLPDGTGWYQAG